MSAYSVPVWSSSTPRPAPPREQPAPAPAPAVVVVPAPVLPPRPTGEAGAALGFVMCPSGKKPFTEAQAWATLAVAQGMAPNDRKQRHNETGTYPCPMCQQFHLHAREPGLKGRRRGRSRR